ncbi:hypothetical protein LAZ67_1000661 [Cordylochernes scorpioides]|uniref:GRIP domain-containing protein n=1 Tax=Cordylochernes scorpioides TaxID=51811 RepID=A0ABY6JW95_9ARAC|nr:hypothetical protein LAZ67_1000661 [Cordylochernes scorpioides]
MELQPLYERAQERVRMLEAQVDVLKQELKTQEERHSQMYLKMYKKGQEAAKFEHADEVLEFAHRAPKRVSVPELLQQLHRTEQELEATKDLYRSEVMSRGSTASVASSSQPDYTLPFLKDAMFYFLTERDNQQHLRAIQNILGFSDKEREAVSKSLKYRRSFLIP